MIKITKPGQKEFHGFCKQCGCEFTYEISDLKLSATSDKVSCPTCGKDYHHPSIVQDPTIPGGISYQWPSDSTNPCAGCDQVEKLLRDGIYVGDIPCTWCDKNRFNSISCKQPSVKDYTTPHVNQLDPYLSVTASSDHINIKAYNKTENKEENIRTNTSTIYNAFSEGYVGGQVIGDSNTHHSWLESCNSDFVKKDDDAKKRCGGKR